MTEFSKMRHKMGYSMKQVSRLYGIPYATIQKWEYGQTETKDYILKMMWELYKYKKNEFDSRL